MKFIRNDPALRDRRRDLRHNQTEAEKAFWKQVRNRQFYGMRFFRQYSCDPYVLDFYCPKAKLAVELDEGQHNEDERKEYDQARSDYLRAHGIEVMRFWNHEVLGNMESIVAPLSLKVTCPPLTLSGGKLHEHSAMVWLPVDELHTLDWAEADWPVIEGSLIGTMPELRPQRIEREKEERKGV